MSFTKVNNTDTDTLITAGSRNEEGFINGLNRQGFTPTKCGMEKIANCLDAYADNISFKITSQYIFLTDDGIGMTPEKLSNMFDANRENHSGDKSMGVSGIGGIISNYQLSKSDDGIPREVTVFTKNKNGLYIKAIIPWDFINNNKKYDQTIRIKIMDETEINQFTVERQNDSNITGTTIRFSYSKIFKNLLYSQFVPKEEDSFNLDNWWTIIFGKTQTNILLDKCDGIEATYLKKYNYFNDIGNEFYCGIFKWPIYFISDNGKDRFITKDPNNPDNYIEITHRGNGYATTPQPINIDPRKIDSAQIIEFTSGMRKDERVFDPNSHDSGQTATFYLNNYDTEFMSGGGQKDSIKVFCSKTGVIRNSQKVTGFTLEGCNVGNARANFESLVKSVLHRSEISYETFSNQDNKLDITHGIQQNKNQNQNEFPTQYVRLIKYLKEFHCSQILNYFKEVKAAAQQKIIDEILEKNRKDKAEAKAKAKAKVQHTTVTAVIVKAIYDWVNE